MVTIFCLFECSIISRLALIQCYLLIFVNTVVFDRYDTIALDVVSKQQKL